MKRLVVILMLLVCVTILSAQEVDWLWAINSGGVSSDYAQCIAVDSEGNCYVTGYFRFTATFGSTTLTGKGDKDIFIAKADKDGNWLWAKKAGEGRDDEGFGIAVDSEGNCYVTGYIALTEVDAGYADIFIAKFDKDGNWLWLKMVGDWFDDLVSASPSTAKAAAM